MLEHIRLGLSDKYINWQCYCFLLFCHAGSLTRNFGGLHFDRKLLRPGYVRQSCFIHYLMDCQIVLLRAP